MRVRVSCVLICSVLSVFELKAQSTCYDVVSLPAINGRTSYANAVNALAEVVGDDSDYVWNLSATDAFYWNAITGIREVSPSSTLASAIDINLFGDVIGWHWAGIYRTAFIETSTGLTDLGSVSGYNESFAYAVNDGGRVVGFVSAAQQPLGAFQWDPFGGMQLLPDLNSGFADSWAFGINNADQIVGFSDALSGEPTPVIWENGTVSDMGILFGCDGARATDINDNGLAVGYATRDFLATADQELAFTWDVVNGVRELPNLAGHQYSAAEAVNAAGQIVGYNSRDGRNGDSVHAVLWENGEVHDLNDFIANPDCQWELTHATDIADTGLIVGWGFLDGQRRSFLLTPRSCPGPQPLSLSNLTPGQVNRNNDITVSGATPGATIALVFGTERGCSGIMACTSETVGIASPQVIGSEVADATGTATFTTFVPQKYAGDVLLFQAVDSQSCDLSNRVDALLPMSLRRANPGIAGQINTFLLENATPGATVQLYGSLQDGTTAVAGCPGLDIDLSAPQVLDTQTVGVDGTATFSASIPPQAATNGAYLQVVDDQGCTRSNLLFEPF